MSLGQAMNTAVAGMRTTQTALSLVAANVANAETPGYVRKVIAQATTAAGTAGVSVRTEGINRVLDQYLQRQLRLETSGGAYADLRATFYSRLQSVYGDPGSSSSLETIFGNFTQAVQALSTNPSDYSARNGVIDTAKVLAQHLNSMTQDIQGLRTDAEQGLSDSVSRANEALQRVAQINQQLATSHSNDATTATLLDQRDYQIDVLSQLMDVRVTEGASNQISVFTSSGLQLVGTQAVTLEFDPQGMMTPSSLWDADPAKRTCGTITLKSPTGASMDLIAAGAFRSGQIASYLEMRDDILVEAQTQIDQLAASVAQTFSDRTVAGSPVAGPPAGFDLDTAGLQSGNKIRLTYTDKATNTQRTITVVRVDDPSVLPLPNDLTHDPNDRVIGVDWSGGLDSVVSQLNAAVNGRLQFSNPTGTTLRIAGDGSLNTSILNSVSATMTQTGLTNGTAELPFFMDGNKVYSDSIDSGGRQLTGFASRITVNNALLADPAKLVVYQSGGTPAADPTRPSFLYDRLNNARLEYSPTTGVGSRDTPFSGTLSSYMRQFLSQQGDAADASANLAEGQAMVVDALQQRFNEGSSVNVDQEMANLLTLQTSYAANARVMTTVKEMLESLLRM
jgi:flagellar hook-associated protein 1 FlgK